MDTLILVPFVVMVIVGFLVVCADMAHATEERKERKEREQLAQHKIRTEQYREQLAQLRAK